MNAKELLKRYAAGEREFFAVDVPGADLRGVDLRDAHFQNGDFDDADLSGANLANTEFIDTSLMRVNFVGTDFSRADLMGSWLDLSDLRRANLRRTDLAGVAFLSANLEGADLYGARLVNADLTGADLRRANLNSANVSRSNLCGVKCAEIALGCILTGVDLTPLCDARNVHHSFPSTIDWQSVALSLRAPGLKAFLVASGMPPIVAEYMIETAHAVQGSGLFSMMQSTFISYGSPDEKFASKLYEALQRNGVTTFFFPVHAVPGKKLHRTMRQGVNQYDRVILICSKASLERPGVLNEIEETLARESRDGGAEYLIPIRLDNYLFDGWNPPHPDVAQAIKDRVVVDFRGTKTSQAKFDAQLMRLLDALKKKRPTPAALGAAVPSGTAPR